MKQSLSYYYQGYRRIPVPKGGELDDLLIALGFQKIEHHCAYEGPVAEFVQKLRESGWKQYAHPTNPFLLAHGESVLNVNYAQSDTDPSPNFVSIFRGF